jgi:hypothetical protein
MTLAKLELAILTSLFIFVGNAYAQEAADYNDGIKQELKKEDLTVKTLPAKKVVHKKIRKSTKKVAQKKTVKKHKLIAKADTPIKSDAVPVVVKDTTPVTAKDSDEIVTENSSDNNNIPTLQEPKSNLVTPIYVLTPAPTSTAPAVTGEETQVQPTTTVDSTIVPEPKSEVLRKQREDLEHQTDSSALEKLEVDRINSEKARNEKLNAVAVAAPSPSPTPTPSPTPNVAPVVTPVAVPVASPTATPVASPTAVPVAAISAPVAAPAPAPVPVAVENNQVPVERLNSPDNSVAAGSTTDSSTLTKAEGENTAKVDSKTTTPEEKVSQFSVGATGGLANYPGVGNITPFYSAGLVGNYMFDEHFGLQIDLDYSNFNITNATYCPFCSGGTLVKNMDQYNFATGIIYDIYKSRVTPLVGALLDYTRRNYSDRVTYGYTYGTPSGSNAFDAGLVAGVDFNLTKSLILGAQFQYFWNLTYNTDNPLAYSYYGPIYGSPVESLSYYIVGLNLRFAF